MIFLNNLIQQIILWVVLPLSPMNIHFYNSCMVLYCTTNLIFLQYECFTFSVLLSDIKISIFVLKLFGRLKSIHWCYALDVCIIPACVDSFEIPYCSALSVQLIFLVCIYIYIIVLLDTCLEHLVYSSFVQSYIYIYSGTQSVQCH